MTKIPIAVQLYSIRDDCARDLPKTIEAIAKMGYDGVEFAGYYGNSAEQLKNLLDQFGLKVAGTHISFESLIGNELEKTIEFNHILGNRFLIVPGLIEERRNSKAAWLETARIINKISDRLKSEDMHVGYHNHIIEFQLLDNIVPWDVFFGSTNHSVVMQLDVGNAMHGGVSSERIFEIIKKYPGRANTVHLKEFSSTNENAILGEGDVDWTKFLSLCYQIGDTEWFIIEQESYAFAPIECVRRCLINIRKINNSFKS